MVKLARYFKPYLLLIIISIAMLFVQANAELALPDYMSKIVNFGIQQQGIEEAVPLVIRQKQLERVKLFLTDEEKEVVEQQYTLIDSTNPQYEKYLEIYPLLADEPLYRLEDPTKKEIAQLSPILGKGLLVISTLQQIQEDPSLATQLGEGFQEFDLSQLPPGMDLFEVIEMLPETQLAQISEGINQQFEVLGNSMINQMAVNQVKAEYDLIGLNTSTLQTNYILNTGLLMLVISLLSGAATVIVGFISSRTASGLARDLRKDMFTKVESFSNKEFDKFSTASLITRSTNDVTQVQMVTMMMLRMVFFAPIMGIGGIFRALDKSPNMWWILALAVIVLLGLVSIVFSIALPKFKIIQSLIDRLNLVTREQLSGMLVIRAFNKQGFEEQRFDQANQELTRTNLFIGRVMASMMPVMMLIMNGVSLLIIWVGAEQVAQATIQVGDMMAFIQYAMHIVFSFLMMSFMFIMLPRAAVSANRIAEVIFTETSINDPDKPQPLPQPVRGEIRFNKVSFRYPDAQENVLCNIDFTAHPGQTTAFIGSTGSGKSTVVNLIPRFYDVSEGAIMIDGVDIRKLKQTELRDQIGYIPQKGSLFTGTIESNLRYGKQDASDEVLQKSIEIAQADEFIREKPEGLETEISQGGTNVSGGQRQRLSIARALVKQPPIYIFDDSFSALDFKTDAALRRSLKEKTADSTILIVTQRVATIKHADQIIVLDEGEIVGKGTHDQLMEACETYREIALSQLSKEELA